MRPLRKAIALALATGLATAGPGAAALGPGDAAIASARPSELGPRNVLFASQSLASPAYSGRFDRLFQDWPRRRARFLRLASGLFRVRSRTAIIFVPAGYIGRGMGRDLWDASPNVRDLYGRIGRHAVELGVVLNDFDTMAARWSGPEDFVVSQLATFAHQAAVWKVYQEDGGMPPAAVIGFSRGLTAALYASGVITLQLAVEQVVRASRFVEASSRTLNNQMVLVKGIDSDLLASILEEHAMAPALGIYATQTIVSGPRSQLEPGSVFIAAVKAAGGRLANARLPIGAHDPRLAQYLGDEWRHYLEFQGRLRSKIQLPELPLYSGLQPGQRLDTVESIMNEISTLPFTAVPWGKCLSDLSFLGMRDFVQVGAHDSRILQNQQETGLISQDARLTSLSYLRDFQSILLDARPWLGRLALLVSLTCFGVGLALLAGIAKPLPASHAIPLALYRNALISVFLFVASIAERYRIVRSGQGEDAVKLDLRKKLVIPYPWASGEFKVPVIVAVPILGLIYQGISTACLIAAYQSLSQNFAMIINTSSTFLVFILSWLWFRSQPEWKEPQTVKRWLGGTLGAAAVALTVVLAGGKAFWDAVGIRYAVGSMVSWAIVQTSLKVIAKQMNLLHLSLGTFASSVPILAILKLLLARNAPWFIFHEVGLGPMLFISALIAAGMVALMGGSRLLNDSAEQSIWSAHTTVTFIGAGALLHLEPFRGIALLPVFLSSASLWLIIRGGKKGLEAAA